MPLRPVATSFLIFFSLIFALNLWCFEFMTSYRGVVKVMIMASLMGYYIANVKKQDNGFLFAMILGLFGDAFLLWETESFFLIGLGCFLIMQLLYAYTFYRDRASGFVWWFGLVALFGVVALSFLYPNLGSMKVPVILYAMAIMSMAYFGIHRRRTMPAYSWVAVGVVLFVISDLILAWAKFKAPFVGSNYAVMITYMLAQYAIVTGITRESEERTD
jgi:uncharacterized membrane protein YhhN